MDSITPQIIPNIYVEEIEDKRVIVREIFRKGSTPYYIKALGKESRTFIRTSSTTRLADESMLKELMSLVLIDHLTKVTKLNSLIYQKCFRGDSL